MEHSNACGLKGGAAHVRTRVRTCALTVLAAALLLPVAHAVTPGVIVGVVRSGVNTPLAGVTVTALRAGGEAIRATVSGSDGVFSLADLPPGSWSLTLEASGYRQAQVGTLEVIAGKATRQDVTLTQTSASTAPATAAAAPAVSPAVTAAFAALLTRAVPEALQPPDPAPANDSVTPFANDDDIGWMNGNTREKAPLFDIKFFTPEVRFDVNYLNSFNNPHDHTIVGSTEEFRSGEFQIEQVSLGGNFHWHNVQARLLSMFGLFATTTPRNDASAAVGSWDLQGAYKYFSEANAGYHWDNLGHGLNVDAGIFVSYIGLFSYYNFDNWTYQPSFVSSNTPWFFNGLRVQYWPTQDLKIEPWLINGWQSYARYNHNLGFGGQILWIPNNDFKLVFNSYFLGEDNLASGSGQPNNGGNPNASIGLPNPNARAITYAHVHRIHEDDSLLWRYYQAPDAKSGNGISKMATSVTWDIGCEYGGGVDCWRGVNKANFFGVMAYDRTWFAHDLYAVTIGGGFMNNPGRYLALLPPINGATASSGTPYFTENPGQKLYQWDVQLNLQYMPNDWITWWTEATFRHSDVPYWSGPGGVTPPLGNTGAPASLVCTNGSTLGADNCANEGGVWFPDLRSREVVWGAGVMVKF